MYSLLALLVFSEYSTAYGPKENDANLFKVKHFKFGNVYGK